MTPLLPLGLSWICAPLFLLADGRRPAVPWLATLLLALVLAADLLILLGVVPASGEGWSVVTGGWPASAGIRLHVDGVSAFFGAVCALVLLAVMAHEALGRVRSASFPALLLFLCAGLHGAFFTGDLFNFYVFFEVSVVTSFALAAYGFGREEVRGAFIYVAANLLGSVIFLTGIAVIYHATGMLDLARLGAQGGIPPLGATLLFAALVLKLGLFPLHGWVPVLYSHAQPAVAATMSGALINIGAYGLLRIGLLSAETAVTEAAGLFAALGALAVVYGALLAARRETPSEIIAYASIAQAGYILLAIAAGGRVGAAAALFVVAAGSIEKAASFLCQESAGAGRSAAALTAALGIAGLPLTLGFFAKIELLRAVLGAPFGPLLAAALVLGTAFLFMAGARYWDKVRNLPKPERPNALASLCLAGATVGLALAAAPLGEMILQLSQALAQGGGE